MTKCDDRVEEEAISNMEQGTATGTGTSTFRNAGSSCVMAFTTAQKFLAEVVGVYFIIFAGCGSVAVNKLYGGTVTFPGICVTWGLIVMVMVYTLGHVSDGHFNPAVTLTNAIFARFSWKLVPVYIVAQLIGSILASSTLAMIFDITPEAFFGTLPAGSNLQSFVVEIIISFLLMFVISSISTDDRATVGDLSGVVIGMTILLNVLVAGPISGASMNPARSIGPAIVKHTYRGLWVYILGPIIGMVAGAFVYNVLKLTHKPASDSSRTRSFLKQLRS
ncbi:PREDICTED: probable aquaporin NIP-type [Ipomoea nil]|uniref:probable aquaporin NIP-type n=1 Tax=Ipomoea nil TaxID=35883 RepID=UPI000901EB3B|nr:PREDICTED: probable aquaporin NIP-type [Ipomoea nil]